MSTINVDNVLPETVSMVNVNGVNIGKNGSNTIQMTSNPILRPTNDCTYIGFRAGESDTASGNTFIGVIAGRNNMTGYGNVCVGGGTGTNNTSGALNTYVGQSAGAQNTQDGNTFIGWNAGGNAVTASNSTCLGANALPSATNAFSEITLGNNNILTLRCAVTSITSLSDVRDKKDVTDLRAGLDFVNKLKPVEFVWNDRNEDGKHDIADFGFIAQDLKATQE
jgi:hypothetical protein